jgi:hypothetical protein
LLVARVSLDWRLSVADDWRLNSKSQEPEKPKDWPKKKEENWKSKEFWQGKADPNKLVGSVRNDPAIGLRIRSSKVLVVLCFIVFC